MKNKRTFFAIKPGYADDINIVYYIITKLEDSGCKIHSEHEVKYDFDSAMTHYASVPEKFRRGAATYLSSGNILALILEDNRPENARGCDFISHVRDVLGDTKCTTPGTIRFDVTHSGIFEGEVNNIRNSYGDPSIGIDNITMNVAHASDSEESFRREVSILNNVLDSYHYLPVIADPEDYDEPNA